LYRSFLRSLLLHIPVEAVLAEAAEKPIKNLGNGNQLNREKKKCESRDGDAFMSHLDHSSCMIVVDLPRRV